MAKKVLSVKIERDDCYCKKRRFERSMVVIYFGDELIGIPARDLTNPQAAKLVEPIKNTLQYARGFFSRQAFAQSQIIDVE